MKKNVNHICGGCGSTGRILTGGGREEVCADCGGIGYQVVEMTYDLREGDRLRRTARHASLEKFILLLSALIGAAAAYFYTWHLSTSVMLICFFGTAVGSYLIMQIPLLQHILQFLYDIFRIALGFIVLLGFLAGVGYLIYVIRLHYGI